MDFQDDKPPPLEIKVTDFNRHEHLGTVVSEASTAPTLLTNTSSEALQKGGIGSAEYDPKQQSIRAYF